jgi:hypothetical protein
MRGMLAGIAAAGIWAAAEPALGRAFGLPWYSERRLLGGLLGVGPGASLGVHLANGAVFGAAFERSGLRGPARGVLAAEAENLALWPAMAIVDRVHADRRSGVWPALRGNKRVLAYEAAGHALFGFVLGALLADRQRVAELGRRRLRAVGGRRRSGRVSRNRRGGDRLGRHPFASP